MPPRAALCAPQPRRSPHVPPRCHLPAGHWGPSLGPPSLPRVTSTAPTLTPGDSRRWDRDRSRPRAGSGISHPRFPPLCAAGRSQKQQESGRFPSPHALPFPGCLSLLPTSTPVENIQLFPGSRRSGRDQLFEELAWRQPGKSPGSGSLLQERWELCTPGLLGSLLFFPWFCLHLRVSSCCSRGHSWLQESSAWRPREQISLSTHIPVFQTEFTLLPFLAFLSQKLAQPLLQHPPQSQSQGGSRPQRSFQGCSSRSVTSWNAVRCLPAIPASLTPSSFCHQEIIVPDNALKQLLFQ